MSARPSLQLARQAPSLWFGRGSDRPWQERERVRIAALMEMQMEFYTSRFIELVNFLKYVARKSYAEC